MANVTMSLIANTLLFREFLMIIKNPFQSQGKRWCMNKLILIIALVILFLITIYESVLYAFIDDQDPQSISEILDKFELFQKCMVWVVSVFMIAQNLLTVGYFLRAMKLLARRGTSVELKKIAARKYVV